MEQVKFKSNEGDHWIVDFDIMNEEGRNLYRIIIQRGFNKEVLVTKDLIKTKKNLEENILKQNQKDASLLPVDQVFDISFKIGTEYIIFNIIKLSDNYNISNLI